MTVYAIAQLSIHDRARYQRYVAAFMPVLAKYGGHLLAADERPEVTEGQWDADKVVLLAFPDRETFMTWAMSPEYQEISADRLAAADTIALLIRGVAAADIFARSIPAAGEAASTDRGAQVMPCDPDQ